MPHFDFVQVGNREIQNGLFKLLWQDGYRPGVNIIMQADDRSIEEDFCDTILER